LPQTSRKKAHKYTSNHDMRKVITTRSKCTKKIYDDASK
jgi:hypothetical protein